MAVISATQGRLWMRWWTATLRFEGREIGLVGLRYKGSFCGLTKLNFHAMI